MVASSALRIQVRRQVAAQKKSAANHAKAKKFAPPSLKKLRIKA